MDTRSQAQLVLHGTIVLVGGMLTGLPLGVVIAHGGSSDTIRAWAVAHGSLTSAGVMLIALGAAARHVVLAGREAAVLRRTLLPSTYILTIGLVVGATAGVRGVRPEAPALNFLLYVANLVGVIGALIAGVLLVHGARAGLRVAAGFAPEEGRISDKIPVSARATS